MTSEDSSCASAEVEWRKQEEEEAEAEVVEQAEEEDCPQTSEESEESFVRFNTTTRTDIDDNTQHNNGLEPFSAQMAKNCTG